MMTVEVMLFAQPREVLGTDRVALHLAEGSTGGQLMQRLAEQFPQIAAVVEVSRLAVGGEFVDPQQEIVEGVDVALVPPVSGG